LANDWILVSRIKAALRPKGKSSEDVTKGLLKQSRSLANGSIVLPLVAVRHGNNPVSLVITSKGSLQVVNCFPFSSANAQPITLNQRIQRDLETVLQPTVAHIQKERVFAREMYGAITKNLRDGGLPKSAAPDGQKSPTKTDGGWNLYFEVPVSSEYAERMPNLSLKAYVGIQIDEKDNPTNFIVAIKSPERVVMGSTECSGPVFNANRIPDNVREVLQEKLKPLFVSLS
jgi:hypothetical protein